MMGMATYNVIVRDGHLVSEDPVDLPEGTKLTVIHDEDMSAEELVALDASLDRAAAQVRSGQVRPARELLAELRARR